MHPGAKYHIAHAVGETLVPLLPQSLHFQGIFWKQIKILILLLIIAAKAIKPGHKFNIKFVNSSWILTQCFALYQFHHEDQ